jgi:hypothetical protein
MNAKVFKSILATTALALFTTGMAFAGFPGHHPSAQRSADVDFTETIKVPNGPTLEPGTYKVALLNESSAPEVGFYQGGKLVGQAPVKLVDQGKKIRQTEFSSNLVDSHTRVITEMDFSGWTEKIVFGGSSADSGSGE